MQIQKIERKAEKINWVVKKKQILAWIKNQPSVTRQCIKLLEIANERFQEVDQIKFAYADMHGNIKIKLRSRV